MTMFNPKAFRFFKFEIGCLDTAERLRNVPGSRIKCEAALALACIIVECEISTDDETLAEFMAEHEDHAPEDFNPRLPEVEVGDVSFGGSYHLIWDRLDYRKSFEPGNGIGIPTDLYRLRQRATDCERDYLDYYFNEVLGRHEEPAEQSGEEG